LAIFDGVRPHQISPNPDGHYLEFGFLMACSAFRDRNDEVDVVDFLCLAAGAYDAGLAASRLLLLLHLRFIFLVQHILRR